MELGNSSKGAFVSITSICTFELCLVVHRELVYERNRAVSCLSGLHCAV